VSAPSNGSLTFNANGSFSYTPNVNYNGSDSFTYKANDGSLDSAAILVSLTITAVNDAPVSDPSAAADAYTTLEDTVLNVAAPGVLANDTDVDGDPLTSILVSAPSNGSLTFNANGSFSYTPNVNYNGPDSFTYKANDGSLDSAPILVSLTITPVNDPPVSDPSAAADAYTTAEDTVLNVAAPGVLANDTDVDGDPLTSILVSGPSHGSLTFNADGSFSYTPNANYNGSDSFTYKANDGSLDSAPILVSLTITAVNDPPVSDPSAAADAYTTLEDTVLNVSAPGVLANDTDVDGDPLTSILVSGPSNGTLSFNANGSFSYTPNANYNGSDSFTYKANDGSLDSAPILVSLTITAVNNPPVSDPSAAADAYTTLEDTVLNVPAPGVLANDTDADGDPLTSILVSGSSNGSLTFNADGSFSYTPNLNYNGSDSFTYKANDGSLDSAPILVSLTITAVNDPPVSDPSAAADAYTTLEDTVLNVAAPGVLANDTDVDGDALTSILVSGPSHGSLTFNADGSFSYTPNANYNGSDSFTYKANDGSLDSAPILVSLTITAVNDPPVSDPSAAADAYTTLEDTVLNVAAPGVLANDTDVDGDALTSILVSAPSNGSLTFNANGSFSYTPNVNYNGPDSFTYKANDGSLDSAPILVSLTITAVNDVPVAVNDSFTMNEDAVLNGNLASNDTASGDGGNVWSLTTAASNGLAVVNANGTFSYTPNANYNGPDSFTYTITDADGDTSTATVSITITAVNDAPVSDPSVAADTYTTLEGTVLNVPAPGVLANDTDVDGDPLTSILVSGPSNGSLTFNADGSFSYTPNVNYNGPDSFTYKANDGSLDSAAILVSITVTPNSNSFLATGTSPGDGVRFGADGTAGTNTNIQAAGTNATDGSVLSFPGFNGEVTVAHADFNNDGILDIVVGAGLGGGPHVRVINGATGAEFGSFFAFDPTFTGGVFVAASDINGDGLAEILVGAGPGGGPHVKVFDGRTFAELKSFFAYDPSFSGGVSVATYNFNEDGFNEIVTGAGPGGAPHVRVFNGLDGSVIKEFMAYALTFRGGVYVAAGDFDNDLVLDIITGAGAGGGPHVIDWEYDTLKVLDSTMAFDKFTQPDGTVIDQLFAGGVRVAIANGSADEKQDLIVSAGPGGGPHVKVYFKGNSLDQLFSYFSGDPSNAQGVFVG
jgi:VCBS repeat-containing protein